MNPLPAPLAPSVAETHERVVRRVLAAPCERVWQALTDPSLLAQWWGPHATINTMESGPQPDAPFRVAMRSAEGVDHLIDGRCDLLVPSLHMVLRWRLAAGTAVRIALTCEDRDDATALTVLLRSDILPHAPMTTPADWGQSFDRLEELLLKGRVHND